MFMVGLISWWYGRGWIDQWNRTTGRFSSTLDFFSVGTLILTLFAPFRQISASGASTTFGGAVRAFVDKLISRVIGAIVRLFTILFGLIVIFFQALYSLVILIAWWLVPTFPIVGALMYAIGWVPTWM